jgi:hypothetical protein
MNVVSTMTNTRIKTPWHLWLVGVIAVLFNAIGAFDYVMSMAQGASYMASAGMTPAQIAHYQQMPIWMTAVWTIGVWGAMLGSVLILLRNRLAFPVFAVSLTAFLVSLIYTYVLTDGGEIMGRPMAITSVVIAALLSLFMWYSWLMTKRSVLRSPDRRAATAFARLYDKLRREQSWGGSHRPAAVASLPLTTLKEFSGRSSWSPARNGFLPRLRRTPRSCSRCRGSGTW